MGDMPARIDASADALKEMHFALHEVFPELAAAAIRYDASRDWRYYAQLVAGALDAYDRTWGSHDETVAQAT